MNNRLKLVMISSGLLFAAAPAAFADDTEAGAAADANATVGAGGAGGSMDANAAAGAAATGVMWWPKSIIDRPITVLKGKLAAEAELFVAHTSITILGMTTSATGEGIGVGGAYGVTDKIEVGGRYSFSLHDFEIKGPLTLYGGISLVHDDKLDVGAGVDITLDFNGTDAMGGSQTDATLAAGLAVRYKVAPKIAIFTGNPVVPGPLGEHLKIGLNSGAAKTFDIPVGVGLQATPELFAYVETSLATILLSDPGMGDRVTTIIDFTPLALGAWFSVNNNIDAGASLTFFDVQHAGDFYGITVGARYFTN